MLRSIRPHSLGIVAAAIAQPNDSKKSSSPDITDTNNSVSNCTDNDSDRNAKTNEESIRINGNPISSIERSEFEEKKSTNWSQLRPTTRSCEATCAVQAADAENGFEYDSTASKFEAAAHLIKEGENSSYMRILRPHQSRWSKFAFKVLYHPAYYITHLIVTILLVLLAVVEIPSTQQLNSQLATSQIYVHVVELVILIYLTVHLSLKFIWVGRRQPGTSLYNHTKLHFGHIIQMIIVLEMLLEVVTVMFRGQAHIRLTRALRPFLVVDNVLLKGVRRELWGIFKSLRHMIDIFLFLFFVIFLFALMGFCAFAEVDPFYYNSFRRSFVSLFILLTTANNPDVTLKPYFEYPASPMFFFVYFMIAFYFMNNMLLYAVSKSFRDADMLDFKNSYLHKRSILNKVYNILTASTDVSNTAEGCRGISLSDFMKLMQCYKPMRESEVLCMFKVLIGSNNQDQIEIHNQTISRERFLTLYEMRDLRWRQIKGGKSVPWYDNIKKEVQWIFIVFRRVKICHKLVQREWFKLIINLVILSNAVLVAVFVVIFDDNDPEERFITFNRFLPFSFAFTAIYCIEVFLRIIGHGVYDFFHKPWNVIDFIVVYVSLFCLILESVDEKFAILAIVRPIKLFRLLRFKRKYRHILSVVIILVPRLLSVGVFAGIVYYIYSIVGIEFFSGRVFRGCCNDSWYNVRAHYTGNSVQLVANKSMAANSPPDIFYIMNFDSVLRSYVTLYALMIINNWFIIMEGFASEVKPDWLVRLYFMSFVFTTLVIFEVVLLFVVDGFELIVQHCDEHGELYCHQCTKRNRMRVKLKHTDISNLDDAQTSENPQKFGCHFWSSCIRRTWRDHIKEDHEATYVGHFPNTKHHIRLQMYRDEQKEWIKEEEIFVAERNRDRDVDAKKHTREVVRKRAWRYFQEVYEYFMN